MPSTNKLVIPNIDQDLQSLVTPSFKPLNQADVSAVTNPPPPVFKASNTDIQTVAGTQLGVVPAPPPAFGPNPAQAQKEYQSPDVSGDVYPGADTTIQAIPGSFTPGRSGVKNIILHSSDGTEKGDLQTLTGRDPEHKVSSNFYVTRAGKVYNLVPEGNTAWHAGSVSSPDYSNSATIGIEQEHVDGKDDWPDTQVQATANLSAYILKKYNLGASNIKTHSEIAIPVGRKQDPAGYPFDKFYSLLGQAPQTGNTASASGTAITPGQPSSADPNKQPMLPPGVTRTEATAVTTNLGESFKQLVAGGLNPTHYGYKDDPYLDPESAKGSGAYVSQLVPGYDVALNAAAAAKVGNPQPGQEFTYAGRKWRYGDKVPEKYTDARFDIFDPNKEFGPEAHAPQFTAGDQTKSTQPAAFGMRVATPDDVNRFNQFIQNGGNPDNVPVYDKLAIAIAKDPSFLSKPENFEEFYGLVYKPLKAQTMGEQFNNAMRNIAPGIWQTLQNLGAAGMNAVTGTYDQAKLAFQKATGNTGADYEQTAKDLAQRQASMSAGIGQGVSDAYNFVTGTFNGILSLPQPILKAVTTDPVAREEIDRTYAKNLQMFVSGQQQVQSLGRSLQQVSATAYGMVSHHAQDLINQATPDPNVVAGTAMLANPLNILPVGEGVAAVGAFKPVFFERAINLGEEAAAATAKKAALDSVQIAPANVMEHANVPGFSDAQNVRAQFTPQANAATKAATQTSNDLAAQLTRLGKTEADPGTANGFLSQVMQSGGKMISTGGENIQSIKEWPEQIAGWVSGGNPLIKKLVGSAVDKVIFGELLEHLGPVGSVASTLLEHAPEVGNMVGDVMSSMGKELGYGQTTLPYWMRVAQQTKYLPKWMASTLDSPLVQTASQMAKGGAVTAATNAAVGALSNPLDPTGGAVGGAVQGGIFGMAGAGFGQWQRYQSPGQYMLSARGDWKRYRDTLPPVEQQSFDKLSPSNQLILGQSMQHFPGLNVRYVNQADGPRGAHFVDPQGRSSIQINLANPESAIAGIMSHELIHAASTHGQLPDIYNALLGDPRTGKAGQYSLLDAQGKPVGIDPQTGRYITNQDFANLKNQYTSALGQSGIPTSHLTDLNIAREIYAEHGVDYLLGGGAVQDANSAFRGGLLSQGALKTALAKIGYTFDNAGNLQLPTNKATGGTVNGTGLFTDMQRNPTLGKLATAYFQTRFREGAIASEEIPTKRFNKHDLQNPNIAETVLQNAAEIRRDANGNVVRDPNTGLPVYRSPAEVKEYNANFAAALNKGIESLPPERLAELGYNTAGEGNTFIRYLPNDVLDAVAKDNRFNPHQIASLRMLSNVLADKGNPGAEVSLFYHKALSAGKKYGQFEGTEKVVVPYGFEITKDGNVNIKSVDFNQLNNNYLKVRNRPPYKDLWSDPGQFAQDAHTYFTNHAQGRPGADGGLGVEKRNAINALGNFETTAQQDANPLVGQNPRSVRSIIKSYRIDRASQMMATGAVRPFVSEEQYQKMNTNYLPEAKTELVKAPAEMRQQTPESQQPVIDTLAEATNGDTAYSFYDKLDPNNPDFSESVYRSQIGKLREAINNDEVPDMPDTQRAKILRQIETLDKIKPGKLTKEHVQRSGKAITQWAQHTQEWSKFLQGRPPPEPTQPLAQGKK